MDNNGFAIENYVWSVYDANSWLIIDNNCGLLIDVVDSDELYKRIDKLDKIIIMLTHSHFDHICGLNKVREIRPDSTVYSTKQCSINIGNKHNNMSSSANVFMTFYKGTPFEGNIDITECKPADITFDEKYDFIWQNHFIELKSFFGHSNDSMAVLVDNKYLFSGDTILPIPTVTRFKGGSTERFWLEDIPNLRKLVVDKVFPGHGIPGSLEEMIQINKCPKKYESIGEESW